ncbi:MAG: hydroxymyristoyl-ACP dehydratase [Panacagrimonas sp.]
MIDRQRILALVPHAGSMCLLDRVERWDQRGLRGQSGSHRLADNPLRSGGRLSAIHLIEYGAQAMAVHGGLLADLAGRTPPGGVLAAARAVELHVDRLDELCDDLAIEVERLSATPEGWLYGFAVDCGSRRLAQGRVAVILHRRGQNACRGLSSISVR